MDNVWFIVGISVLIIFLIVIIVQNGKGESKTNKYKNSKAKIPFAINDLIKNLGEKNNITNYEASYSKLKVNVIDLKKVNLEGLKELGASGIIETSKGITILFGAISSAIATELDNILK